MAREVFVVMGSPIDRYQNHVFHLFDLTPPRIGRELDPLFVMSPQAAFSEVGEPSLTLETIDVKSGTSHYPRKVVKGASYDNITLSKGLLTGDQEFYDWIMQAVSGRGQYRRKLGLVQIHGLPPRFSGSELPGGFSPDAFDYGFLQSYTSIMTIAALAFEAQDIDSAGQLRSNAVESFASGVGYVNAVLGGQHIPACRIWTLYDCIPVSYKAGDGFSATSDDVTIASLEIAVDGFDEYSFGPNAVVRAP